MTDATTLAPLPPPVEARLHRAHGALTALTNGRHAWSADVGKLQGSNDAAPGPHDLLDSALAACTVLTLELYIRRKNLAVTDLRVQISHEEGKTADGRVRYAMQRTLHVEGAVSDADRLRLLEIAGKCPIHRLLEGETVITTTLAPSTLTAPLTTRPESA